jgi:environmental stress-induced protein Ves
MPFEVLALSDMPPVPWKNHAGSTRELCIEPPGSNFESFIWRVSIAEVAADSVFSTFDGIDRTIVLLSGDGLHLHLPGGTIQPLTSVYQPFAFAGELQVQATLQGGATQDFNLMVRRSAATGSIAVYRCPQQLGLAANASLLFVAQGEALLTDAEGHMQRLRAGDRVCFGEGQARPQLQCGHDAVVLAVHIDKK